MNKSRQQSSSKSSWSNVGSSFKLTSQQVVAVVVGFSVGAAAAGFFRLGYQLGQVFARVGDAISMAIFTELATHRRLERIGKLHDLGDLRMKYCEQLTFQCLILT